MINIVRVFRMKNASLRAGMPLHREEDGAWRYR
nr:MAG TPA: hypothetical protein [Caudoviricetes sp.]